MAAFVGSGTASAATKQTKVVAAKTDLGKVLATSRGQTLYLFQLDTGTQSQCNGACATNWPPLLATGKPAAKKGAKASLVGTSARADGTMQVTYNGHPVYMFMGDQQAHQTNGEGINAFGGSWYAVSPSGSQVNPSSNATSSSSSNTPGY